MSTIIAVLAAILVLLQVVDLVSTLLAFRKGDYEANPIIGELQEILGQIAAVWIVKLGLIAVLVYAWWAGWFFSEIHVILLLACIGWYIPALVKNIKLARGDD